MIGDYKVWAFLGLPVGKLASNAPFTVATRSGSQIVRVNCNEGAGQWNLLATFADPRYVSVSNAADGVIIAVGVKSERIGVE